MELPVFTSDIDPDAVVTALRHAGAAVVTALSHAGAAVSRRTTSTATAR